MLFGAMSTALAEQFPTHVRTSGLAIAYNIAVMMFGGFALLGGIITLLFAVETRGRVLEELSPSLR